MKMISDLPWDLVEEILSKVPITCLGKVRSTCKRWNSSSKDRVFCKSGEARHQFLGFMVNNFRVCSIRFDLHGILKKDSRAGLIIDSSSIEQIGNNVEMRDELSIKQIGNNNVEIRDVFHCDGLLLCVTRDNTRFMVWNPYLGQTRWIQPRSRYVKNGSPKILKYALGYDKNGNHKILTYLRFFEARHTVVECEIYDFKSDSWRVIDVSFEWDMILRQHASLKGNAYFFACVDYLNSILLCFDFTKESFGQFLHLPASHDDEYYENNSKIITSLRDEKLAVLVQDEVTDQVDIWVTSKIEPNEVCWSHFLKFNMDGFGFIDAGTFFIDEAKKLAVVFDVGISEQELLYYNSAVIIGENGYLKEVDLGAAVNLQESLNVRVSMDPCPVAYSSTYVPSLVQITRAYKKENKRKRNNKL